MSTIISYISGHKTEFCVSALISSIFSIALFLIYHLVILFQGGPLILDYGMVPIVLSLLFTLVSTFSFFQLASLFAKKKGGSITMAIIGPFQFSLRKAVYVVICIIGIIGIITSQYVQFWTGLTGLPLSDNVLMAYIPNPIQFLNNTILLYYTYPVSKYPEISNSVILQGKQKFLQTNGSKWIVQFDQFGFVSDAIEPIQTSSYIFSDAEQQQWTEFLKRNAISLELILQPLQ